MSRCIFYICISICLAACYPAAHGTLKVGHKAPSVKTATLADVGGDFSRITTYRYPDARMYQWSIDRALASGRPIVLEFATPGHCTVCDNQLQMLKGMMDKYGDEYIFVHLDQYQNPQAFKAFRVVGDPWTMVVDASGTVQFTRPGRILYQELEPVLKRVNMAKVESQDEQERRL